jgi:hypothetical protein
VVGAEPAQLALTVCDLAVELVYQAQARVDRIADGAAALSTGAAEERMRALLDERL